MAEKSLRGFAAMDRAKQRAIASKGGRAAHAKGTAHEFTPEEARLAGRKGGQAAHAKGTAHEFTPEEAREAGRKGGQSSHSGTANKATNTTMSPENHDVATNSQAPSPADQQEPQPVSALNPGGESSWDDAGSERPWVTGM